MGSGLHITKEGLVGRVSADSVPAISLGSVGELLVKSISIEADAKTGIRGRLEVLIAINGLDPEHFPKAELSLADSVSLGMCLPCNGTIQLFEIVTLSLREIRCLYERSRWIIDPIGSIDIDFQSKALGVELPLGIEDARISRHEGRWLVEGKLPLKASVSADLSFLRATISVGGLRLFHNDGRQALEMVCDGSFVAPDLGLAIFGTGIRLGKYLEGGDPAWIKVESLGFDLTMPPNESQPTVAFTGDIGSLSEPIDISGRLNLNKLPMSGAAAFKQSEDGKGFIVGMDLEFAAPRPLGSSGLAVFEIHAVLGYRFTLAKRPEQSWYDFLISAPGGIPTTDFDTNKYREGRGLTAGFGAKMGTLDKGFLFSGTVMGVVSLPDFMVIYGRGQILGLPAPYIKEDSSISFMFWLAIGRQTVALGADVSYKLPSSGLLLDLYARAEGFYDLEKPDRWYLRLGHAGQMVTAKMAGLVTGKGYVSLNASGLEAVLSYDAGIKMGPLNGWYRWGAEAKVNYQPFFFQGRGRFYLGGELDLGYLRLYAHSQTEIIAQSNGRKFHLSAGLTVSAGVTIRIGKWFKLRISASARVSFTLGDSLGLPRRPAVDPLTGTPDVRGGERDIKLVRRGTFDEVKDENGLPDDLPVAPPDSILEVHFARPVSALGLPGLQDGKPGEDPLTHFSQTTRSLKPDFQLKILTLEIKDHHGQWLPYQHAYPKLKDALVPKYWASWDRHDDCNRKLGMLETVPGGKDGLGSHHKVICPNMKELEMFLLDWNDRRGLMESRWYANSDDTVFLRILGFSYSHMGRLSRIGNPQEFTFELFFPRAQSVMVNTKWFPGHSAGPKLKTKSSDRESDGVRVVLSIGAQWGDTFQEQTLRFNFRVSYDRSFDMDAYLEHLNAPEMVLRPNSEYCLVVERTDVDDRRAHPKRFTSRFEFHTGSAFSGFSQVAPRSIVEVDSGVTRSNRLPALETRLEHERCNFDTGAGPYQKPIYSRTERLQLTFLGEWMRDLFTGWNEVSLDESGTKYRLDPMEAMAILAIRSPNGRTELSLRVTSLDSGPQFEVDYGATTPVTIGDKQCVRYKIKARRPGVTTLVSDLIPRDFLAPETVGDVSLHLNDASYAAFRLPVSIYPDHDAFVDAVVGSGSQPLVIHDPDQLVWMIRELQLSKRAGFFSFKIETSEEPSGVRERKIRRAFGEWGIRLNALKEAAWHVLAFSPEPFFRSDRSLPENPGWTVSRDRSILLQALDGEPDQVTLNLPDPIVPEVERRVDLVIRNEAELLPAGAL